jgi:two-component system phosphate regulon response regulator PhoB
MSREEIFVVDDEEDILELLDYNLTKEGYRVRKALSGESALEDIQKHVPDLIILDLMLPGMNGLEAARELKRDPKTLNIPIIMLTAKGEEIDIVTGLEVGADDYITKPFSPRVLVARVRAAIRKNGNASQGDEKMIRRHEIVIHPGRRNVTIHGEPLDLTYTEFQILFFLASRPGWVFTRSQIVDAVRGDNYSVTDRSVDVQMVGLRKKLGLCGKYIETVRGVGYRFME